MDKRIKFYVSRKDPMTWLMALCMFASAVIRIVFACMRGSGDSGYLWGQTVLPAVACLYFGLICLLSGREYYFRTAIPVYLMALYLCFYTRSIHPEMGGWGFFMFIFMYFTLATVYALAVDGKIIHFWVMLPVYLVPLGVRLAENWGTLSWIFITGSLWRLLPDALFYLGLILGVFATRIQNDGKYHPTWGDRTDGRRVRTLYPMDQLSPYLMVHRNEANNMMAQSFDISAAERYIRQKRKEGLTNFGLTHLILAAYARTVAKYPTMNRFISGQKVYSKGEDLQVCITVKKEMTTEAPDSVIKAHLSPRDTAKDVYEKFGALVEEVKNAPLNSDLDNTARYLSLIPGIVLKFVVWLLKLLDYFGKLPGFLLEVSPFHASMYMTSMGSLGIPPIYHHLYNFGNVPMFIAFGSKRNANEITDEGEVVHRKYLDLKFNMDERITDGFTYAAILKYFRRLIMHPEVLDQPPETVKRDID